MKIRFSCAQQISIKLLIKLDFTPFMMQLLTTHLISDYDQSGFILSQQNQVIMLLFQ